MFPSSSDDVDPMGATSSSVGSSDSPRTVQSYARLALAGLLAWLAWGAFRDEFGTVPLVSDIDLAIHEFGHMLLMPFGIQFLGSTMMILGGSLTQVAFPLLFFGSFLRKQGDVRRRDGPKTSFVGLYRNRTYHEIKAIREVGPVTLPMSR